MFGPATSPGQLGRSSLAGGDWHSQLESRFTPMDFTPMEALSTQILMLDRVVDLAGRGGTAIGFYASENRTVLVRLDAGGQLLEIAETELAKETRAPWSRLNEDSNTHVAAI